MLLQVLKYAPKDKDAMRKYKECSKVVQAMLFAEAIATDDSTASVAGRVETDLEHMRMYSSPSLIIHGLLGGVIAG